MPEVKQAGWYVVPCTLILVLANLPEEASLRLWLVLGRSAVAVLVGAWVLPIPYVNEQRIKEFGEDLTLCDDLFEQWITHGSK